MVTQLWQRSWVQQKLNFEPISKNEVLNWFFFFYVLFSRSPEGCGPILLWSDSGYILLIQIELNLCIAVAAVVSLKEKNLE